MTYKNDQISELELFVILRELGRVLSADIDGDVVELGCYKGLTSVEIQRVIAGWHPAKRLWLYDSFAGLPPKVAQDNSPAGLQFKVGELPASKKEVIRIFMQAGLTLPTIKKGWFHELTPSDLPDRISFAFLDGDFYESIMDSLKLVWPKLSAGAVVVVDDYQNEALPGAAKAVQEWLKTHPVHMSVEASLAIIRPALH